MTINLKEVPLSVIPGMAYVMFASDDDIVSPGPEFLCIGIHEDCNHVRASARQCYSAKTEAGMLPLHKTMTISTAQPVRAKSWPRRYCEEVFPLNFLAMPA